MDTTNTPAIVELTTRPCSWCNKDSIIYLDAASYLNYSNGAPIQDAFPFLSPDERELIISGTHPKCWDEMFPSEDEDYE